MNDWRPLADIETLAARADLIHAVRDYFSSQALMEVSTPTLGRAGVTDTHLQNLSLTHQNQQYFLQTSPEYAMKRLLAAGSGSIYQICPAYRGGEQGTRHNLEFTMLEWYRLDYALTDLMQDTQELLTTVARVLPNAAVNFEKTKRLSYQQLFRSHLGIDPHRTNIAELESLAASRGIDCQHINNLGDAGTLADYLDLLFSLIVEPTLVQPTIVYDYPACQVALAQLADLNDADDGAEVARRFELFVGGMELANGYLELADAEALSQRFEMNNRQRQVRGLPMVPLDHQFLQAMKHFPACSGIALGIDRLVMILLNKQKLSDVLSFS